MAHGIQIDNTTGRTLITSDNTSYHILEMGIIGQKPSSNAALNPIPFAYWSRDQDPGAEVLTFIRPVGPPPDDLTYGSGSAQVLWAVSGSSTFLRDGNQYQGQYTLSGRCFAVREQGSGEIEAIPNNANTASIDVNRHVEYCIVRKATDFTAPEATYGLNIFDANEDVQFSSEFPCARIRMARTSVVDAQGSATGVVYQGKIFGEVNNIWISTAMPYSYKFERFVDSSTSRIHERVSRRYFYYDYQLNQIKIGFEEDLDTNPTQSEFVPTRVVYLPGTSTEIIGIMI
jgi:hypothetical protein